MFYLKTLGHNHFSKQRIIENGIRSFKLDESDTVISAPGFWGETEIHIGDYSAEEHFEKGYMPNEMWVSYASEYFVKDLGDGFKKIVIHAATFNPDDVEGYIVFSGRNIKNVKTDGNKIFQRYLNEVVVELKEGQYLEYDSGRVEVHNGKLMLVI